MNTLKFLLIPGLLALMSCGSKGSGSGSSSGSEVQAPSAQVSASSIELETYRFDDLSEEVQNQISGAGCGFGFTRGGGEFCINGLIKVNGLYELLEEADSGDESQIKYRNKNWELKLKITSRKELEEGAASELEGEGVLRSLQTGKTKSFGFSGSCGC
jgi:hypothetical protein